MVEAAKAPGATPVHDPLPELRVVLQDKDGKALCAPIAMVVPRQLSARIAKMHVVDYAAKNLKAAADEALKAMGFK